MCLFLDLFKKIYRCTLLQEHRFTGAHCYRSTNPLLEHKFTDAHCYRSTNSLLEHKFTGAHCYRSTNLLLEPKLLDEMQVFFKKNLKLESSCKNIQQSVLVSQYQRGGFFQLGGGFLI